MARKILNIAFDCETYKYEEEFYDEKTQKTKKHFVVSAYLLGWCTSEEPDKLYYSTDDHQDFVDFLTQKYAEGYKLKGYIYNANYDLPVLLKDKLNKLPGATINYRTTEKGKFINCSFSCDAFNNFTVEDAALWDEQVPNLASYLKLLGLPGKLDNIEYEKYHKVERYENGDFKCYDAKGKDFIAYLDEELEYLKRDVLGLLKVVEYQKNLKLDICKQLGLYISPKNFLPGTASAFAKEVINMYMRRRGHCDDYFDTTFRPEIPYDLGNRYKSMELSSIGGFTACNKLRLKAESEDEKIFCYDVNSMYPANMIEGLPVGEFLTRKPKNQEYFTFYEVHLTYAEWKKEEGKDYSYISTKPLPESWCIYTPEGEIKPYILKEYYDVLIDRMDSDIHIVKKLYMLKNTSLTEFLNIVYKKKLEAENIKDPAVKKQVKSGCKILMNGLYGKACQKVFVHEKFYRIDWEGFDIRESKQKDGTYYPYRSLMAGIYICQKSRATLLKALFEEIDQGNEFLYCDTDSLLLKLIKKPKLKLHNTALGAWKCEGCGPDEQTGFTLYLSLGVKKKKFLTNENLIVPGGDIGKLTFSGVSNSIQQKLIKYLTLDQMKFIFNKENNIMIKGGKLQKSKNIYGQTVLISSDIKINAKCTKSGKYLPLSHELIFDEDEKKYIIEKYTEKKD